jgi:hypothetical protein
MLKLLLSEKKTQVLEVSWSKDISHLVESIPLDADGYSIEIRKDANLFKASGYKHVDTIEVRLVHDYSNIMTATIKNEKVINVETGLITSNRFTKLNSFGENIFLQAIDTFQYVIKSMVVETQPKTEDTNTENGGEQ